MNKKQKLLDCFKIAIENKMNYVAIVTKTNLELQVAVIGYENYPQKIEQIIKNYKNNLQLKKNKNIKIIDYCCGDSIESLLYDILTME